MTRSRRIALALVTMAIPLQLAASSGAAGSHDPWVDLDGGRIGNVTWNVAAARSCLRVGAIWKTSPLSFLRQRNRACASSSGRPRPSQAPLVASAAQPSAAAGRITAVGMLVPAAVKRVEVTFSDGVGRPIRLHPLNPLQARKADLGGYQYAAFVFRGLWCAERTVTKSSGGRVLWDSGVDEYACE